MEIMARILTRLAEQGVSTDIQEYLVYGNPATSVPPKVLEKAVMPEIEDLLSMESLLLRNKKKDAEIERLREALNLKPSNEELKLAEKHCDWNAFKHAFSAVMKHRRSALQKKDSE